MPFSSIPFMAPKMTYLSCKRVMMTGDISAIVKTSKNKSRLRSDLFLLSLEENLS
jgi:hypothetical protein